MATTRRAPALSQTISKRGYRFLAEPTRPAVPPEAPASISQAASSKTIRSNAIRWTLPCWYSSPVRGRPGRLEHRSFSEGPAEVSNYVAITHDGLPKQGPLALGRRSHLFRLRKHESSKHLSDIGQRWRGFHSVAPSSLPD